jgi:hypothetical protein
MTRGRDRRGGFMNQFVLSDIDLHLFDEGIADQGVAPQTEGGAQIDASAEEGGQIDRDAQFETFINGDFKDAFHKRTQTIIDKRFKKYKDIEAKQSKYDEVMNYLMEKNEVADVDMLLENLKTEAIEDLAYRNNMEPKTYLEYRRGQEALKMTQQEREEREIADKWRREEDTVKKAYPEFNLVELLSRTDETASEFFRLARSGIIPLQRAYEITHLENIKKTVAKQAEEATIKNIQAKGIRPREAATSANDSSIVQKNVSSLTSKERAELAQRAARGETVRLGR